MAWSTRFLCVAFGDRRGPLRRHRWRRLGWHKTDPTTSLGEVSCEWTTHTIKGATNTFSLHFSLAVSALCFMFLSFLSPWHKCACISSTCMVPQHDSIHMNNYIYWDHMIEWAFCAHSMSHHMIVLHDCTHCPNKPVCSMCPRLERFTQPTNATQLDSKPAVKPYLKCKQLQKKCSRPCNNLHVHLSIFSVNLKTL